MFSVGKGSCGFRPYDKLLFPVHIQANLEDELVKEALKTVRLYTTNLSLPSSLSQKGEHNLLLLQYHLHVIPSCPSLILFWCLFTVISSCPVIFIFSQGVDLRHYSKQVELELQQIEQKSIRDCILQQREKTLLLRDFVGVVHTVPLGLTSSI